MKHLKAKVRSVPNFPVEGVTFRDITTLMQNSEDFREVCNIFYERYKNQKLNKVIGIDARGFIFGAALAFQLNAGFVPIRKKGKLPYTTISEKYELEYGTAEMEIHKDALQKGDRVVIIDDVIATGGTVAAAVNLAKNLGSTILECAFVIELSELKGRDKIKEQNIFSIMKF